MEVLFAMLSLLGIEIAPEQVMNDDRFSEQTMQQFQSLKTECSLEDEELSTRILNKPSFRPNNA